MHREPRTMAEIKSRQTDRRRRAKQIALRVVMALILLAAMAAALLLSACSTDDDRDICCEETTIFVRYCKRGARDAFKSHIHSVEYLIFDEKGLLTEVLKPDDNSDMQRIKLKLDVGKYTLIGLGNGTAQTVFANQTGVTRLEQLTLRDESAPGADTDPLYYTRLAFEAKRNKKSYYIADMSNIHCGLRITVRWARRPPPDGEYRMVLENLALQNNLKDEYAITVNKAHPMPDEGIGTMWQNPEKRLGEVVHLFPWQAAARKSKERSKALSWSSYDVFFRTLRYQNDRLPVVSMYDAKGESMFFDVTSTGKTSKKVDLTRTFKKYGLVPEETPLQYYHLLFLIDGVTGKIEVSLFPSAEIIDWQDGGTIPGTV